MDDFSKMYGSTMNNPRGIEPAGVRRQSSERAMLQHQQYLINHAEAIRQKIDIMSGLLNKIYEQDAGTGEQIRINLISIFQAAVDHFSIKDSPVNQEKPAPKPRRRKKKTDTPVPEPKPELDQE